MSRRVFSSGKVTAVSILTVAAVIVAATTAFAITSATPASADPHSLAYRTSMVQQVDGVQGLSAIACSGSKTCLAVGHVETGTEPDAEGVVVPIVNGKPGSAELVQGTVNLSAITCPSASTCIAVGDEDVSYMGSSPIFSVGEVVTITNGSLGVPQESSPPDPWLASPNELFLYGVACTKVSSCVAVGNTDAYNGVVVPIKNGEPGQEKVIGGESTLVDAVTCSKNCYAVGTWSSEGNGGGAVVPIVDRKPVGLDQDGVQGFTAVTCYEASTSCMAVGPSSDGGFLLSITSNGSPQTMAGVSPTAITCRTAVYCAVVGSDSQQGAIVRVHNETPGAAKLVSGAQSFDGVACFGPTDCLAVGSNSSGAVIDKFSLPG
jgi:hypothetical protein